MKNVLKRAEDMKKEDKEKKWKEVCIFIQAPRINFGILHGPRPSTKSSTTRQGRRT
jgi:hypothetical protein